MSGIYLKDLVELRKVEWSRSWTWDIKFEDDSLPEPFKNWFPATDVEEGIFNLEPYQITAGLGTFEIPKSWTMLSLSITFVDNADLVLEHWLDKWVNETIFGGGTYVATLEEAVKTVHVAKLNGKRELVASSSYLVFPTGPFNFSGTSTSEIPTHQVEFRICRILSKQTF